MNAPDRALALAHYTAQAEQARSVDFERIAAQLSAAQNTPTLAELRDLLRPLVRMIAAEAAKEDPSNAGWFIVASDAIDWAFEHVSQAAEREFA